MKRILLTFLLIISCLGSGAVTHDEVLGLYNRRDSSVVSRARELRLKCDKPGDRNEFFWTYFIEALYYVNDMNRTKARVIIYEMQDELAGEKPDNVGWAYLNYILGRLYYLHTDYILADSAYEKCLAIPSAMKDPELYNAALTEYARNKYAMCKCEDALSILSNLVDRDRSEVNLRNGTTITCLAYGYLGEKDGFLNAYEKFKTFDSCPDYRDSLFIEAYADLYTTGNVNVEKYADKLEDIKAMKLRYLMAKAQGQATRALTYYEEFANALKNKNSIENNSDFELVNMSLSNELLRRQNNELQLEHEQQRVRFMRWIVFVAVCLLIVILILGYHTFCTVKKKNAEILAANQEKTDFVQTIAHDVRTPLNAVVGFSQLLALPPDFLTEEERNSYSEFIGANAQLLTILIDDVLTAGNTNQKMSFMISETNVNQIGKQAVLTCQHRCKDGVEMFFTSSADDSLVIKSDPNRCLQVLINFLTNATKNTENGTIELHCSVNENPGKITFAVTDTGCGIPPMLQDAVFERFVKLDRKKQGSGIGLAICRQIAEALHAKVKLDKNYKNGSRFLFVLPMETQLD
ncbi:MAG: HAMP domain-containing histidine kinase [Bacteroidales bacterium]|nr:HAMP domain-containing histidine kinase [Bacteroidales bacterium]